MTIDRDRRPEPRPDHGMENRVSSWLTDSDLSPDEANRGLDRLLEDFPVTPQTRRRFLGRWLDRDEGVRRRTDRHDHPPDQTRRNRLMLSATGITAALAILALTITVNDPAPMTPAAEGGNSLSVTADGSGDYTTIQAAVDAAADGDTITIAPGTYTEAVVVDKDLAISGDGPREDIVLTIDEGPIMHISDSEAMLSGLSFSGSASEGVLISGGSPTLEGLLFLEVGVPYTGGSSCLNPCTSVLVTDGSTATVRDSVFIDGGELAAEGGAAPVFEGNELTGGPHIPLFDIGDGAIVRDNSISGTVSRAIGLFGPTTALVEGNTIVDPGANGIDIGYSLSPGIDPVVRNNSISGANQAINVAPGAMPTIEGNRLSGNNYGISTAREVAGTIVGNELMDNDYGMALTRSVALVEGNTFSGGHTGIVLVGGSPTLQDNTIESAGQGLVLASAVTPSLVGNSVCGNELNLVVRDGVEMPDLTGNDICEDAPAA